MLALLLVAASLGLSNFAAAVGIGVSGVDARTRLRVGIIFGVFETAMPILGLLAGRSLADTLGRAAHWIGAALLIATGIYTLIQAIRSPDSQGNETEAGQAGRRTGRLGRLPDVADQTANVVAWSAGVSAVSATLAGILASRATTPLSKNPWFILCMAIAIVSFAVLLLVGPRLVWVWWRGRHKSIAPMTAPTPETAAHPPSPISAAREAQSLRGLIEEGEAMQARVAGQRGPLAIVPPGLSRNVADWEERVSAMLASRPELLSQFRAATGPASPFSTMVGPAGKLHDQMSQRIQVLKVIRRSLPEM